MHNFSLIRECLNNYQSGEVSSEIAPGDPMANEWYMQIGRSALDVTLAALMACKLQSVDRILDLPCGYGRVLRHLAAMFPAARIDACDLDRGAVDFCASRFGAIPVYSAEDLTSIDFNARYDLIWVGSLFTHTSAEITRRWMAHLARFLSPCGVVIATLHGRWSVEVHSRVTPYIGEDRWRLIHEGYAKEGYGYCDYPTGASHAYIQGSYGVSLAKPHAIVRFIEEIPGVRIFSYLERGWGEHQDVVVFGKPAYELPWPGMEERRLQDN